MATPYDRITDELVDCDEGTISDEDLNAIVDTCKYILQMREDSREASAVARAEALIEEGPVRR